MIPDQTITPEQIRQRHDALAEFADQLQSLRDDLKAAQTAQAAAEARANRAESLARLYESQLVTPHYEGATLLQTLDQPENIKKLDAALAEKRSARWEILNITVLPGTATNTFTRVVTLGRIVVDLPAVPDQPVAGAATKPDTAATAPVTLAGLEDTLSAMSHVAEWIQGAPLHMAFVPRVYAVFEAAGCDMTGVKIMKSFKPGRKNDQWTMTAIFPRLEQVDVPDAVFALKEAGFREVIARDGLKLIFDLPEAWTTRKTITAASMTIIDADDTPPAATDESCKVLSAQDARRAQLHDLAQDAYNEAMARSPLPPYRAFPFASPSSGG